MRALTDEATRPPASSTSFLASARVVPVRVPVNTTEEPSNAPPPAERSG